MAFRLIEQDVNPKAHPGLPQLQVQVGNRVVGQALPVFHHDSLTTSYQAALRLVQRGDGIPYEVFACGTGQTPREAVAQAIRNGQHYSRRLLDEADRLAAHLDDN